MTILRVAYKSLRQHAVSTCITALSIALAGGLLMSVWSVKDQAESAFTEMTGGFDAVLGARSARLQLVLNAVFHLDSSPGNVAWEDYLEIQKHPGVALALPIAMGDNYQGYRLVGTTTNLFTDVEYAPGKRYQLASGRVFEMGYAEAVVGNFVAQRLGLKPGDDFHPFHGLIFDEKQEHAEEYKVVGVLEPSNTPADRVIWIPLEGIQNMTGHDEKAAHEISAVLVKLKSPLTGRTLELAYNKEGQRLTFAWPIDQVVAQLFDKIGWFNRVLALVAYLVAIVAIASVLASIYNSMNERRREIAILRALGARRRTIFSSVVLEAGIIAALGMILAFGFYAVILSAVAKIVRTQTGVALEVWAAHPVLLIAPMAMILLSAAAGCVPAWKGYRVEVAENLSPVS
jgi:putative ABC transport system permease protein